MMKSRAWQFVLMVSSLGLVACPAWGLSILVGPPFYPDIDITPRLVGLGYTVYEIDPATWDSSFDYSAYDVVAFQFYSGEAADVAHLVAAVEAEVIGVVFFRGSLAEQTAMALGLISSGTFDYQLATQFNVVDNSHEITQNLDIATYNLLYTNMTHVVAPGANTTTLANGPNGAALVVHNTKRVVATPFYGHFAGYDNETEIGRGITDRCLRWAAGEPIPVVQIPWGTVKSKFFRP